MPLDPDNPLALEIRQEMGSSYFAACRKMVAALDALKAFSEAMARLAPIPPHNPSDIGRAELLAEAIERVYYVIIQREAMQLPHHEAFFEVYEVPEEVRTQLGPRPRQ